MNSSRTFLGYILFPVHDEETGRLDYWDIHEEMDGHPIAEGLPTLEDAKALARILRRDQQTLKAFDRMFG